MDQSDDDSPRYWFRPKRFGYGASPATIEGWLVVLGFVALVIAIMRLVRPNPLRLGLILPLLAGFLILVARKTEGDWRWRWGSRD